MTNIAFIKPTRIEILGMNKIKPPTFICRELNIARGTLTLLCGTGGSGKTFLAQYMATCAASGLPFLGFGIERCPVLHIDMEQHDDFTQLRYERLGRWLNLKSTDIVRTKFSGKLDNKAFANTAVFDLVEQFKNYGLVIIDSLKKISEADENSSDIERVMYILQQVAHLSNCAILLIHHKGKSTKDVKQSGRGHSSIYDSVDSQIDLDASPNHITLKCAKNRSGMPFKSIDYVMQDEGSFVVTYNCYESISFARLDAVAELEPSDVILRALADGDATKGDLQKRTELGRVVFSDTLEALVKDGKIIQAVGLHNKHNYSLAK